MLKVAAAILGLLFFFQMEVPGQSGPEIRLLNEKRKEMAAGSTSNVLILLNNPTETEKEIQLKLITPESWRQITDYSSIRVEQKSGINKILTIHIPENTSAGNYSIQLEAFEKSAGEPFGKVTIPITILPRYEIRVDKLKAPVYLFAGDTLTTGFLIRNLSNLDVAIKALITNDKKLEERLFTIPADSGIVARVAVAIPKNLINFTQALVTLSASVSDKPETEKNASYIFDVIPGGNQKFDGFNRFPIKVSGLLVTHNRNAKREYGSMFDLRGGGVLNEAKQRKLDFHFRGPDRGGNPILGLNDEYYLNYSTPRTHIRLGDHNFRLTDLTESSRSGRGIGITHTLGKISIGSFFHFPRYFPGTQQILALYSNYRLSEKIRLDAGYLMKFNTSGENAHLLTVSGMLIPFRWINADIEVAGGMHQGRSTKGFRTACQINYSIFRSHFSLTQADPGFPGYFSNSSYLSSGITANLKKKVSLSVNYDRNRSNLALDTLYSNAPFSRNFHFLTSYRMNPKNSMSIGFFITGREDRAIEPLFNYSKYTGRIMFQSRFGHLSLLVNGEIGKMVNYLKITDGELTNFYKGYASGKYTFNETFSAEWFLNYQGGQQYLLAGFHHFYYGGSLQMALKKKTYISFDYQNNYEIEEYYRDRSLLALRINQIINQYHEIEVTSNYNLVRNSLNKKELNFLVKYTYTINAPISRKENIGSLTGKITNSGVEQVEGIVFNLNGNIAITDKDGVFEFPMLKVGTYLLAMDESSAGLNTIAGTPGPYRITIEPGKQARFELTLTQSAKISGQLLIKEDEKSGKKGYYPVKEEIENLIVEASNGPELFRILTSRNGTFTFDDLRPGDWQVKIYPNGIPKGYQLESDLFRMSLTSGEDKPLKVNIYKRSREIRFQKNQ
ncbi:MAG TPA: hypothetical protein DC042_10890 [Bacteroidales bacterium]|nr:hypothetical protein [Bacteroidales bacterium]